MENFAKVADQIRLDRTFHLGSFKKRKLGGKLLKYQNPSSPINFQPMVGEFLPQSVLVKKKEKTSNPMLTSKPDPNAGKVAADTGTRILSALKTFGMSPIGNVIKDVGGQEAADAVEKYTLGMIPYTRDEEFKANRTN
jgi:hypothetical protein